MPIRVYIVEDHDVMRESLREFLVMSPDLEVCGEAATVEEAVSGMDEADPSVVLLDLSLPDRNGLHLLREIRERWGTPCIILSAHGEHGHVEKAFAGGARGYLVKGRPQEIPLAIRTVLGGEPYVSGSLAQSSD